MSDLIGQMLGPYQIVAELGRGGMANVYRAIQPAVKREVAIKILPSHFLQDQQFLARFNREAEVIAKLQHPRILPIYDFGEHNGQPYIVMAYMPAGTLADLIRRAPGGLPIHEVARLVAQIAEGMDYAHRKGIIHRDFKPSNVLLDEDGNVHLADFGIAKVTADTAQLTGSGMIGTPQYMAPEMSDPDGLSPLVDIYALGVTLYQMLTGRHPYEAPTPMGVLMAHIGKPIPDAREHRPDLPDAAQTVIEGAMAKNPAERYQSAGDIASALADVMETLAVTTAVEAVDEPLAEPRNGGDTAETMAVNKSTKTQPATIEVAVPQDDEQTPFMLPTEKQAAPRGKPQGKIAPIKETHKKPESRRKIPVWVLGLIGVVVIGAGGMIGALLLGIKLDGDRATTAASPAVAATPLGGGGGRIAFESDRSGYYDVYVMNVDGSGLVNLTNNAESGGGDPAWSPDGTQIAFKALHDDNYDIYVMAADGSGVKRLTDDPGYDALPDWSPDGTRIVFQSNRDGNDEIYAMNADGSQQVNLTNNPRGDTNPKWSPGGGRIVFVSDRDPIKSPEIYVMDSSGSSQTQVNLTNSSDDEADPAWSPDGTKIAYYKGESAAIYIMNSDGTDKTRVTYDIGCGFPAWSPDGAWLAMRCWGENDAENIYVINVDGTNLKQLTDASVSGLPDWQPVANGATLSQLTDVSISNLPDLQPTPDEATLVPETTLEFTQKKATYGVDGESLYVEDFEDGVADEWYANIGAWNVRQDVNGNYYYHGTGPVNYPQSWVYNDEWQDYAIQLRIRFPVTETVAFICVRAGRAGDEHFFFTGLSSDGWGNIGDYFGGEFVARQDKNVNLGIGQWYTVQAEIQGAEHRVYINDELIFTNTNSKIKSGGIGVYIGGGKEIEIDDVLIWLLTP